MNFINKIINGDCREVLKTLPDNSIDCCVTSPPYFGLRDYGHGDQIGLEDTPEKFVAQLVEVFTEVKRVLKESGTLWLNLGDSYSGSGRGAGDTTTDQRKTLTKLHHNVGNISKVSNSIGLKPKNLIGIPWKVAFALQESDWILRQDIIWAKPNPMPESVTDRCTKSHEYIFLLSKSGKYYYDADAIKTELQDSSISRLNQNIELQLGSNRIPGKTNGNMKAVAKGYDHRGTGDKKLSGHSGNFDKAGNLIGDGKANKRSVWTCNTTPFSEAHFATFPEKLIEDCIKAGCPEDGIVLDPFSGAGTTALVAAKLGRNYCGIELNPEYVAMSEKRLRNQLGIFHKAS